MRGAAPGIGRKRREGRASLESDVSAELVTAGEVAAVGNGSGTAVVAESALPGDQPRFVVSCASSYERSEILPSGTL